MKSKPETELKDIFKNLKPALLFHQTGDIKKKKIEDLDFMIKQKIYNKEIFYLTEPFTGITKKEAAFLVYNYFAIKDFRKSNREVKEKISCKKNPRLWPLPLEVYNKYAERIYEREGRPVFGKRRIDGIIMGDPITTFSNYVNGKSYSSPVIKQRLIGIKPIRCETGIKLFPTIDINAETRLTNWRERRHQ